MKLAIVGSRAYTNRTRIELIVNKYIAQYNAGNLIVISGGCPKGGDYLAKEVALEKGLLYREFPPAHAAHNCYCVQPPDYFGKRYHVNNFFQRNQEIAQYCDHLVAFIVEGIKCNGTMHTFTCATKLKKQCFLFEDKVK